MMTKTSTSNIAKAIYLYLKDKKGGELELALKNAVEFLAKKNLLSRAPEILKYLEQIQKTDLGIVTTKVLSKNPLAKHSSDELKLAIKKRYEAEDVILEFEEDHSLLGGIRIETGDEVIDLSLKNKLNQLQAHLLGTWPIRSH